MGKNWILSAHYKSFKGFSHSLCGQRFGSLISVLSILILKHNYHLEENTFAVDLSVLKIFTWGVNYAFFALLVTLLIYGLFTVFLPICMDFFGHHWIQAKHCWH